jgi:hypothetical protein
VQTDLGKVARAEIDVDCHPGLFTHKGRSRGEPGRVRRKGMVQGLRFQVQRLKSSDLEH